MRRKFPLEGSDLDPALEILDGLARDQHTLTVKLAVQLRAALRHLERVQRALAETLAPVRRERAVDRARAWILVDRDYYQILLIVPDAPAAIIEASYRTLKQRLRAKPGSVAAEALLDEAYRVLSDPEQRAAYDLERDVALSERSAADFAATAVLDPDAARYAAHRCLFCGTEHGLDHALERDDDCRECASRSIRPSAIASSTPASGCCGEFRPAGRSTST